MISSVLNYFIYILSDFIIWAMCKRREVCVCIIRYIRRRSEVKRTRQVLGVLERNGHSVLGRAEEGMKTGGMGYLAAITIYHVVCVGYVATLKSYSTTTTLAPSTSEHRAMETMWNVNFTCWELHVEVFTVKKLLKITAIIAFFRRTFWAVIK